MGEGSLKRDRVQGVLELDEAANPLIRIPQS